jgi:hypothetical protein
MLVRAGAPFFRHQLPLLSTSIDTVEGCESFGGTRGMGRFPLRSRGPRVLTPPRGMRGLGAVLNYCQNNPPDAVTAAIIAARGDSIALVPCGGTPTPQGLLFPTGNQPYVAPSGGLIGPAPVYQPPTGIEDCVALGLATSAGQACVQRNTQRAIDAENAHLQANANYQTSLCVANNGGGWVPPGGDVTAWCMNQYGGVPGAVSPGAVQPSPPVTPAINPPAAVYSPRVSIRNLTSPGAWSFKVGDQWQVTISGGAPNSPVQVTALQSGGNTSTSVVGNTDSSGNFTLPGTMPPGDVGSWQETWSVGGVSAGSLSFSVVAAAGGGGGTVGGGTVGGGGTTGGGIPGGGDGGAAVDVGGLLTGRAFLGLPNWVWLAGVGGLMFLGGRH